jgi:hypothetical protein
VVAARDSRPVIADSDDASSGGSGG